MAAEGANVTGPSRAGFLIDRRVVVLGLLFLVDLLLTVVMLVTDKNLQSDFGTLTSTPPYYLHWYGLLVTGILDLVAGLVVLASVSMASRASPPRSVPRWVVLAGLGWAVLSIVAMLGIVATYAQVGFASATDFAKYLFSVTASPGSLPYIPWLYDLLLAMYILTAIVGAFATMRAG